MIPGEPLTDFVIKTFAAGLRIGKSRLTVNMEARPLSMGKYALPEFDKMDSLHLEV